MQQVRPGLRRLVQEVPDALGVRDRITADGKLAGGNPKSCCWFRAVV